MGGGFDSVSVAAVLVAGLAAYRAAVWLRVPDVVMSLVAGLIIGPIGLGLIGGASAPAAWVLTVGAVLILYEGARRAEAAILAQTWDAVAILATLGVGMSAVLMAGVVHFVVGWPIREALILGAVLAPTDPASVISVFRTAGAPARLVHLVTMEAATNDATGATLSATLLGGAALAGRSHWAGVGFGLSVLRELGLGVVLGGAVGIVAAVAELRWGRRLASEREHGSLVLMTAAICSYALATATGGSGFLAAYAAGLVEGTLARRGLRWAAPRTPAHERAHTYSLSVLALLARTSIFVVLGASVRLVTLSGSWVPALIIVAGLMLVARPISVFASMALSRRSRFDWREMAVVSWVRETGVLPAALAAVAAVAEPALGQLITTTVFVAAIVTLLVQGTTTGWLIVRLGLAHAPGAGQEVDRA